MPLSGEELAVIQELKTALPKATGNPKTATEAVEMQEPSQESILAEATPEDLLLILGNSLEEINVLVDEILKKPELKDNDVIGFLSNMKGLLLGMVRDITDIKRGSYRTVEEPTVESPERTESFIKPQLGKGESLVGKQTLRPGESFVSPAMNEMYR